MTWGELKEHFLRQGLADGDVIAKMEWQEGEFPLAVLDYGRDLKWIITGLGKKEKWRKSDG